MKITFENISFKYGQTTALDKVNLTLENGIYDLLGPDGAGKTTLLNIMVRLLEPTEGQILFDGQPVKKLKGQYSSKLGYLPHCPSFFSGFTARELLSYFCRVKKVPAQSIPYRISELLDLVGLADAVDQKISLFTEGMRKRLGIARTLLNEPSIVVFDEPTVGLTQTEIMTIHNVIAKIADDRIVLLTSSEANELTGFSSQVIQIKDGQIVS